ncbi:MAG: amidohydrolase family protein [Planctomycetota bacterium]|jgi:predicted TIM-barrel fold metal-dependent hydrolase
MIGGYDVIPARMIDVHTHPGYPPDEAGRIIEFMDDHNLEKIVALGSASRPDVNECILRLRAIAPDRVIGGPYLDPREKSALDEIERFHDAGCRIAKLFPNLGYYPDDPRYLPFFERLAELGWGVLSHCGWLGSKGVSSTKYARPGRFEELFRRFPDTLFIMAHMGGIDGFLEGIMYTTRTPNVYLDTTPGQSYWVVEHAAEMVRGMPPERLLLGTDGIEPVTDDWDCSKQYDQIAAAIEKLGWGGHLDDIFYNNAALVIAEYGLLP